jgi:hypothetical protein
MSRQWAAAASQKSTCPGVTGVVPAITVAVSVITLPDETVVTALPPLVMASVTVVAGRAETGMQAARSQTKPSVRERLLAKEWPLHGERFLYTEERIRTARSQSRHHPNMLSLGVQCESIPGNALHRDGLEVSIKCIDLYELLKKVGLTDEARS